MKIQQAVKILANTKIMLYEKLPSSGKDRNLLNNMMCCVSNFEPEIINEAFKEIIKWWLNTEIDIMEGKTPNLDYKPNQKEMVYLAIRAIREKK